MGSPVAAAAGNYELIDRDIVLKYMKAAAFWLVFAPSVGVVLATKFNFYDFLGAFPG